MSRPEYEFSVRITRDGEEVGRREVGVGAAVEDALFRSVLAGRVPNGGSEPDVGVEPEWSAVGPPRITGLRVALAGDERRYDARIFREHARKLMLDVAAGARVDGRGEVRWQVCAEARARTGHRRAAIRRAALPLVAESLPDVEPGAMRVTVGEQVLVRLRDHMETSPGVEVAGLLTGRIGHDADRGAARLHVGGYHALPPGTGGTSRVHFALDPGSFIAARRALRDLPANEVCCGWSHDHFGCEACPTVTDCRAHTIFFSHDDVQVHSGAFPSPFQIAVVAGKAAERSAREPAFQVFGWRAGMIAAVDFELTHDTHGPMQCALLPCATAPSRRLDLVHEDVTSERVASGTATHGEHDGIGARHPPEGDDAHRVLAVTRATSARDEPLLATQPD